MDPTKKIDPYAYTLNENTKKTIIPINVNIMQTLRSVLPDQQIKE